MKPKQLRKVTDGRIFTYTEALAARSDMVPVWPDGVDPNWVPPKAVGLRPPDEADESRVSQLRDAIVERDKQLLEMQRQLDEMTEECASLGTENARLSKIINDLKDTPPTVADAAGVGDKVGAAIDPGPAGERQEAINAAVLAIYEKNDPLSFTGQGKPRIPAIEELCDITGVTAEERDVAMAAFSKE